MTIDLCDHERPAAPVVATSVGLGAFVRPGNDGIEAGHRTEQGVDGIRMENRNRPRLVGIETAQWRSNLCSRGQVRSGYRHNSGASSRLDVNDTTQVRGVGGEGLDFAELNKQQRGNGRENKGFKLPEEEERSNGGAQVVVEGRNRILKDAGGQTQLQQQQQLQQSSAVRWERFLPQRQLQVLLVEYDDSTRHVVSALLRNCSYEVTPAANGLEAWELLEDPSNNFDLVLTEVVMPCLSGIGLLCRITAHEACKHIPVIMMSSHDSMGIVFKCLSKGAVDFLVKPVRKNELKNLWQHVWRRCHSSSGSGSGNVTHALKVYGPKSGAGSGNNTGSNHESDNVSSGVNNRDGSDNGSGTQSSWTKRGVEVESPRLKKNLEHPSSNTGPPIEVLDPPTKSESLHQNRVRGLVIDGKSHATEDHDQMGQDLQIAIPRPAAVEVKFSRKGKDLGNSTCAAEENALSTSSGEGEQNAKDDADQGIGWSKECPTKVIDLIGGIDCQYEDAEEQGDSCDKEDKLDEDIATTPMSKEEIVFDSFSIPMLELSLKRSRPGGEVDGDGEDRRVLRQSGSSAFSRYNTSGSCMQLPSPKPIPMYPVPPGFGGRPFMQGNNIGTSNAAVRFAMPAERAGPLESDADMSTPVSMHAHVSRGNNIEDINSSVSPSGQDGMGTTLVKEETVPISPMSGQGMSLGHSFPGSGILTYDGVPAAYGPMHPMFYSDRAAPPWGRAPPNVADCGETHDLSGHNQSQVVHPEASRQSYHHHHHHHVQHHYHHHHYQKPANSPTPQEDEQMVTAIGTGAPRCGSSNGVTGPEGNNGQSGSSSGYGSNGNGNGSVNGSATGSKNGSNGRTGPSNGQSGTALVAGGSGECGTQNGNGLSGTTGNGMAIGNACASMVVCTDQNRVARREAALTKFRQKRKERCFEKKVRYQSRKRLAEQRPRVRGQFVRQSVVELSAGEQEHEL